MSSGCDECGVVAKHQAAVGGQALPAPPHHFNRQVHGDRTDSQAAEKFRGPARAGGKVQDPVVGAGSEELAGDGEVEQVIPTLLRGRPVEWEIEAGGHILLFVSARFGIVGGAIDAGNVPVLPLGQFLCAHRVEELVIGQPERPSDGRVVQRCTGRRDGTARAQKMIYDAPETGKQRHSELLEEYDAEGGLGTWR